MHNVCVCTHCNFIVSCSYRLCKFPVNSLIGCFLNYLQEHIMTSLDSSPGDIDHHAYTVSLLPEQIDSMVIRMRSPIGP